MQACILREKSYLRSTACIKPQTLSVVRNPGLTFFHMWPFKKKSPVAITPISFESILCIPGNWISEQDVKLAIVEATNGEYIVGGDVMINSSEKRHFTFEVCERDERMKLSFSVAGRVTHVTEPFLDEIDKHTSVVYISAPTGDLVEAKHIAYAGEAILKAGGIGIKVETAGKAFNKEAWFRLTSSFQESNLYEMFVIDTLAKENGTIFSCGMQNLGLKDSIVSGLPFQEAADLLQIFGYYQVVDKPIILTNQTFSPTHDSPRYRITEEVNPPYKDKDLFGNPFGMWRLTKE
jgi:hypothetical protein